MSGLLSTLRGALLCCLSMVSPTQGGGHWHLGTTRMGAAVGYIVVQVCEEGRYALGLVGGISSTV